MRIRKGKLPLLLILVVVCILLGAVISSIFYSFYYIKEIRYIPMWMQVKDYTGITIDTDALGMGTVIPGGSAIRRVAITNRFNEDIRVRAYAMGQLRPWTTIEGIPQVLSPNENATLVITVKSPRDSQSGNYSGTLKIVFTKDL